MDLSVKFDTLEDYVCKCCPHERNSLHANTELVLTRICKLILDSEGCTLMERQFTLFSHYFGTANGGLTIVDLQFLPIILEYLSQNLKRNIQYLKPLLSFLHICRHCPVINKSSDLLMESKDDLTNYMTSLGHCLILLDGYVDIQSLLLDIIDNLWSEDAISYDTSKRVIPYSSRREALEQSALPVLLTRFLLLSPEPLYHRVVINIYQITVYSIKSSRSLLENCCFEQLVIFSSSIKNYRQSHFQCKQTVLNILWQLLECCDKSFFANLTPLPSTVLRLLDKWLRYEVIHGTSQKRNDILSLISKIIFSYDNLDVSTSHIQDDLFTLCAITELDIQGCWASNLALTGTKEDLQFKKILIITIAYMLKDAVSRLVAKKHYFLQTILLHLDPSDSRPKKTNWTSTQKWELIVYCLNVIPFFAPLFPEEYIKCGFSGKIVYLIEYFASSVKRPELVCNCLKTLHMLLLKRFVPITHFIQISTFEVVFCLTRSNAHRPMSTLQQLILSYAFSIMAELCIKYTIDPRSHKDAVNVMKTVLEKFVKPGKDDFKIDESLIITAGSFIWMGVKNSLGIHRLVIQEGLIYYILDIIESSPFPLQLLYTGVLAEIAEDPYSVVPLITWRGKTEYMTIIPLLCHLWRTQEKIKHVKRKVSGCVADTDHILKGRKQIRAKPTIECCPPLLDLFGCIRPRIYAIVTLLLRDHFEVTTKAIELYRIQLLELNITDQVTLLIIRYYEHIKKGEIWENMLDVIKNKGETMILPVFITQLEMLASRYYCWGVDLLHEQNFVIKDDMRKVIFEEGVIYSKLTKCLEDKEKNNRHEIQYQLCTSNPNALYVYKLKYKQIVEEQRKMFEKYKAIHPTHNLDVYVNLAKCGRNPLLQTLPYSQTNLYDN